jgi:protein SCO1/2
MSRLGVLLLLTCAGPGIVHADGTALKAGVFSPARMAPDFTLRGSNGADVVLSHFRGKVVLLSFGYTSCTEVCPITLAVLARARTALGPAGADLQVVYVTVDPERDNAGRMHAYLANFDPTFIGGTGTAEQLAGVRKAYGITATKLPGANGYGIAHSSFVYLIERDGSLRAMMPFGHSAEDYVHDVRLLLKK